LGDAPAVRAKETARPGATATISNEPRNRRVTGPTGGHATQSSAAFDAATQAPMTTAPRLWLGSCRRLDGTGASEKLLVPAHHPGEPIRDAHMSEAAFLMQPRWAMSLLRGPLTRAELARAIAARRPPPPAPAVEGPS
jgi:hypothetical protein